jgi:hypothetical protein
MNSTPKPVPAKALSAIASFQGRLKCSGTLPIREADKGRGESDSGVLGTSGELPEIHVVDGTDNLTIALPSEDDS